MKFKKVLSSDIELAKIIDEIPFSGLPLIHNYGNVREQLIESIVSQQLSIKVAPIIFQRFLDLYGGKFPTNQKIIDTQIESLRSCGLSYQKANYIQNIATYFKENKLKNEVFQAMTDEEIIKKLTEIKGVGKWTVEMVLIFCLGREDVFSTGDYGIQMAMKNIYKLKEEKKELEKKMLKIAEKWRPFRTYSCLYLWASKDLKVKI